MYRNITKNIDYYTAPIDDRRYEPCYFGSRRSFLKRIIMIRLVESIKTKRSICYFSKERYISIICLVFIQLNLLHYKYFPRLNIFITFSILFHFHTNSLIDINECSKDHMNGCHHTCTNLIGGYFCSCDIGYRLHNDKRKCNGK